MYLYVLALNQGRYYVGTTTDINKRIQQHFEGNGSSFTRIYHPQKVVTTKVVDEDTACLQEDFEVKRLMIKYGIDNVRGGSYSTIKLSKSTKIALTRELNHANGACFICGESSHWATTCPKRRYQRSRVDPEGGTPRSPAPPDRSDARNHDDGVCFICGESTHWAPTCPKRCYREGTSGARYSTRNDDDGWIVANYDEVEPLLPSTTRQPLVAEEIDESSDFSSSDEEIEESSDEELNEFIIACFQSVSALYTRCFS